MPADHTPIGQLTFIARRPAMKKVLSPTSDKKISAKAAKNPDRPRTEFAAQSCGMVEILLGWSRIIGRI